MNEVKIVKLQTDIDLSTGEMVSTLVIDIGGQQFPAAISAQAAAALFANSLNTQEQNAVKTVVGDIDTVHIPLTGTPVVTEHSLRGDAMFEKHAQPLQTEVEPHEEKVLWLEEPTVPPFLKAALLMEEAPKLLLHDELFTLIKGIVEAYTPADWIALREMHDNELAIPEELLNPPMATQPARAQAVPQSTAIAYEEDGIPQL